MILTIDDIRTKTAIYMDNPDVQGVCLLGSYAAGSADKFSDIDICVFFADEVTILPNVAWPIACDLWLLDRTNRQRIITEGGWEAASFFSAQVLHDRCNVVEGYVREMIQMKHKADDLRSRWDAYLNDFYRSLKYRRKGNVYAQRACAAHSVMFFMRAYFGQNQIIDPLPGLDQFGLRFIQDKIMPDNDLIDIHTKILCEADAASQAKLFFAVEKYLTHHKLNDVIDDWNGQLHLEVDRTKDCKIPQCSYNKI